MALPLLLLGALLTSQAMAACSDREAMAPLDEGRILGTWYYAKQTDVFWPEGSQLKCPRIELSNSSHGDMDFRLKYYNITSKNYVSYLNNLHKATEGSTNGKYVGHLEGEHDGDNYNLNVVTTDYSQYLVLWTCGNNPGSSKTYETTTFLTGERNPSDSLLRKANAYLPQGNNITIDHSVCPQN